MLFFSTVSPKNFGRECNHYQSLIEPLCLLNPLDTASLPEYPHSKRCQVVVVRKLKMRSWCVAPLWLGMASGTPPGSEVWRDSYFMLLQPCMLPISFYFWLCFKQAIGHAQKNSIARKPNCIWCSNTQHRVESRNVQYVWISTSGIHQWEMMMMMMACLSCCWPMHAPSLAPRGLLESVLLNRTM